MISINKVYKCFFISILTCYTSFVFADEKDITQECCVFFGEPGLVGPGSVSFVTKGDTEFSFGSTTRIIPTYENDWDFGLSRTEGIDFFGGQNEIAVTHFTESGVVAGEYLRGQANVYFNALPKSRDWSFFLWLQADAALDISTVDQNAGAGNQESDFGIERLHLTGRIPGTNMRLHTGWALWDIDMGPGAGLVYLDDNPGVWLTGWDEHNQWDWSLGWFKLRDNSKIDDATRFSVPGGDRSNLDRNLIGGFIDHTIHDGAGRFRSFFTFDAANGVPVGSWQRNFAGQTTSTTASTSAGSDADVWHVGGIYTADHGPFNLMLEGVYEFGDVDDAGLAGVALPTGGFGEDKYDVKAYALAGMLKMKTSSPLGFTPHIGFQYTSGDDDADDGDLSGYTANLAGQRFTAFGGENTFLNDTHMIFGTALFGFLPEGLGNGTPVFSGGIDNFAGFGFGRGDNPGLKMLQVGFSLNPSGNTVLDSSVRVFGYNEDIVVDSLATGSSAQTVVDSGYAGTEFTNQLTYAMNSAVAIKVQGSLLFPGKMAKDISEALGAGGAVNTRSDDVAKRVAAELVWNF